MRDREVRLMTPFQERACQGIFVMTAIASVGADASGYNGLAGWLLFAGVAIMLLPLVFPVPAPGSFEEFAMRMRHWNSDSGTPRPRLPYERD